MKSRDGLYVPVQFKKKKDILNIRTNIKKKTRTNTKNRLNDFIYHANDLLNSNSFLYSLKFLNSRLHDNLNDCKSSNNLTIV